MWVTKLLISLVKIWLKIGVFVHFWPGLAGSFGALLVGWSVAVARGLYLARHLFTLLLLLVIVDFFWDTLYKYSNTNTRSNQ